MLGRLHDALIQAGASEVCRTMRRSRPRETGETSAENRRRYQLCYPRPTDGPVVRKLKVEIFRQQAKIAELRTELTETRADLAKLKAQLKRH